MDKDKGVFMTAREVNMEIEMLKTVFDIVRLVDVSRTAPVNIGSDDCSYEAEHKCFAVWNKGRRCENCISAKVFARKNKMTKFEFVNDDIYQVIAKYVVIDGTPLVMEMVFKMTDKIFLGAYGSGSLIDKISRFNRELYEDPLTGARNRRYFEEQLKSLDKMGAIAMIDVDNFKQVNDRFGHAAGDAALYRVAQTMRSLLRSSDALVRYGGDEFFLLFQSLPRAVLHQKLEVLCCAVRELALPEFPELHLTISVGGVHGQGRVRDLILQADTALYEAKIKKDCVVVYEEDANEAE